MTEQLSGLTLFVNHYFGHFALALLSALHIQPTNPELPIPEHVVMAIVALLVGTLLAIVLRARLSVEKPGAMQQVAELLLSNLMGAFPSSFLKAPTAVITVPLSCAILTLIFFNWQGIRHHGVGRYLLTFAGSPKDIGGWILAVLLFPVDIISTSARLLSLTVRLWGNMFASDLIYMIFLGLLAGGASFGWSKSVILGVILGIFPATIPVLFIGLHLFVSVVQAYVFTVLPSVYLGLAISEEH